MDNLKGIKILGTSSYVPETIYDNEHFAKYLDTNDEWITTRTGIKTRHIAENETNKEMAVKAAKKLLENTGIKTDEIGFLVVASFTQDYSCPSLASQVWGEIAKNKDALCFDISAACSGFLYSVEVLRALLSQSTKKYGMIIASEKISSFTDYQDRETCILFGDGAGAVIIEKSEGEYYSHIRTESNLDPLYCMVKNNTTEKNENETFKIKMKGREVFKFAVRVMQESVESLCEQAGIKPNEVDHFVIHQANERIISHVAKKLSLDFEKFHNNLSSCGNTSAASIPIVIDETNKKGKFKKGDYVMSVAFGSGLVYGGILFTWN